MKITVVSDTHGNFDALYSIVEDNKMSDLFVHLGDGEDEFEDVRSVFFDKAFIYVGGNNDWDDHPQFCRMAFGGHTFYMCHGHRFPRALLKDYLSATAVSNKCDVVLFGHTHVPCDETVNGVKLFNPGSPTLPRGGNPPTYGIISINDVTKELKMKHIPFHR